LHSINSAPKAVTGADHHDRGFDAPSDAERNRESSGFDG
jgi:hypothetical protein